MGDERGTGEDLDMSFIKLKKKIDSLCSLHLFSLVILLIAQCLKTTESGQVDRIRFCPLRSQFSVPYSTISIKIFNEAFDNLLQDTFFPQRSLYDWFSPGQHKCEVMKRFPFARGSCPFTHKIVSAQRVGR